MQVRDILDLKGGNIFSIPPDAKLVDAIKLLVEHDIGSLVVLEGGEMIGMLTFREVLSSLHHDGGTAARVRDVMVHDPVTCAPEDSIDHMRAIMTAQHIRYLPIKSENALLGVLSFHDVARAALKAASLENRALKEYIKNWPEQDEK